MNQNTAPVAPPAPSLVDLERDLRRAEERLGLLSGKAEQLHQDYARTRETLGEQNQFLELAPEASARLEELTEQLFGELLDEIENNLSHAVREVLGQERRVVARRDIRNNRLSIEFEIEREGGEVEHILKGQGGSVCNIVSVGLRFIALSQLDPALHRPFLVLDESDCWLKPDLVPVFMKLIGAIAKRLQLQVLVISHHPVDLFAAHVQRIYGLEPHREDGVRITVLRDALANGEATPSGSENG